LNRHPRKLSSLRILPTESLGKRLLGVVWLLLAVVVVESPSATGQYRGGSSYPYSKQRSSARRLPSSAEQIGGFTIGNPYKNNRTRPSGLPVGGNRHSYYGGGGGNPMGRRPTQKPFANTRVRKPLVTGMDAAHIEVARGLWRY